jgi:hypothetical protein
MSKQEKVIKSKQARTVEIKLLVPYAIIVAVTIALAGLITGWMIRSDFDSNVRSQVTAQYKELTSKDAQ